jgi:hypothetical protein
LSLDLSAAFDTVNYDILFECLENHAKIKGNALKWFKSYLRDRQQHIFINGVYSRKVQLKCSVPQGSCAGPQLFITYLSKLYDVISCHLPQCEGYADDSQLYLAFKAGSLTCQNEAIAAMESCVSDVRRWFLTNKLKINDAKTELIIFGSKQQLAKLSDINITVGSATIHTVDEVRNLGSIFDKHLTMEKHISAICKKTFFNIHKLWHIHRYLDSECCESLVHALVSSHLDYCNSLLYNLPVTLVHRL